MKHTPPVRSVLFVCTGNICRSPTAEGVMRRRLADAGLADVIRVDSCGTHDYHVGEPPDARSRRHAKARGYDLSALRARQVAAEDFEQFDLLLVADESHLFHLQAMAAPHLRGKVRLLMDFAPHAGLREVPDPYYGGAEGFERVLDLIESAVDGVMAHVLEANDAAGKNTDRKR